MKNLKISAKNFRSFSEINWSIPEMGLYLIEAKNHDTGGSNLAGKTTLCDSIFFCLYGYLPKWGGSGGGSPDNVIKRGSKTCELVLEFSIGQERIKVVRKRGPASLTLHINGSEVHGKSADLQRDIDRRVMSPDLFLTKIYMSQKRKTNFYSMTDGDRTDLLSRMSGLQEIDRALELVKKEKDAVDKEVTILSTRLESQSTRIEDILSFIEKKKEHRDISYGLAIGARFRYDTFLSESKIRIQESIEAYESRTKEINTRYEGILADTRAKIVPLSVRYRELKDSIALSPQPEPELFDAISSASEAVSKAKAHNRQVDEIEKNNEKIRSKIERLLSEAEAHLTGKCQSCNQDLPEWTREQSANAKVLQATDLELQIKSSPPRQDINELPLRDAEAALTNRKSELSALPNRIKSEMLAIESDIRNLNSIIELMQTKQSQELGHAIVESNKIESLESKGLAEFKNELSKAEIMSETSEKALTDAAEDLEKQKAAKESIQQIISFKADEMTILQDLSELFGSKGYRSVYFDSMISRISDKAGSLMSIMTDGVYSTRLEQIGSDSKGNSKVILKPYITKGGQDVPPDDMSGGAEDRAMLAYDIAIGEIDSDGSPLFLDESVGGIDYVGKMEMMTLLEEVSRHRPVIVIDHSESFKAAFTNIISIDYSKGNSVLAGTQEQKESYGQE